MRHTEFVQAKRKELLSVANAMLREELNLIEGVRKVCSLRHLVEEPNSEVFVSFRAIDSETDHFPIGELRSRYAKDKVDQLDQEMHRYLIDAREEILSACQELVRYFSEGSKE
jgi:hypothetical protein